MKILVESGATKSEWRIIGTGIRFFLRGTNVSSMHTDAIKSIITEGIGRCRELQSGEVQGFYLYTAGVLTGAIRDELSCLVRSICPHARIEIREDIVGAARGVLGHEKGIVAIMGTGSNAFFCPKQFGGT